MVKVLETQHL